MKSSPSHVLIARTAIAAAFAMMVGFIAFAGDDAASATAVDSAAAIAAYPLTTCVVSGDALEDGDMGPPINYVYKQEGKPDRLVRFCCKHCIKKFNKDPEKYLKKIDDAAKSGETKAGEMHEHEAHHDAD